MQPSRLWYSFLTATAYIKRMLMGACTWLPYGVDSVLDNIGIMETISPGWCWGFVAPFGVGCAFIYTCRVWLMLRVVPSGSTVSSFA